MSDERKTVEDYSDYEGGKEQYDKDTDTLRPNGLLLMRNYGDAETDLKHIKFKYQVLESAQLRRIAWLTKRLKAAQS